MKRLMLTAATLAALTILVPAISVAQHENQVGIYTDAVGTPTAANFDATPNVPFDVYLVINHPVNNTYNGGTDTGTPVTAISGFEAKVLWPTAATFFVMSEVFPANAIDAAGDANEYAVGFDAPVAVTGDACALVHWQVMVQTTDPYYVFLDHIRFDSIDGYMAYVDANDPNDSDWQDGNLSPMHHSTGDQSIPVFSINDTAAVAIDGESWGGVKALFR